MKRAMLAFLAAIIVLALVGWIFYGTSGGGGRILSPVGAASDTRDAYLRRG